MEQEKDNLSYGESRDAAQQLADLLDAVPTKREVVVIRAVRGSGGESGAVSGWKLTSVDANQILGHGRGLHSALRPQQPNLGRGSSGGPKAQFTWATPQLIWEYLTTAHGETKLEQLGQEGWELCAVLSRPSGEVWVFKRVKRA